LGERLLAEQSQYVADAARRFHGDTLLWAGCHTELTDTVHGCMIRNRLFTFCQPDDSQPATRDISDLAQFQCELHAIPLPNNSLDGAVLHHGLELAEDPRTAVRELARVLAPGSRLLVCGFNPMSLWGLRYAYARFFQDSFSGLRMVSPGRLLDWLTVLGFELCEEVRYMAYGLPFGLRTGREHAASGVNPHPGESRWSEGIVPSLVAHNPPIGGVYMISAVKQALGVRRNWGLPAAGSPKLAPVAYPKLSAWSRIERPG
jgi:SAM-dependent methyltransferase